MLDCHYNISTPLSQFLSTFKIMNEAGPGQALISYQIEANRLQKNTTQTSRFGRNSSQLGVWSSLYLGRRVWFGLKFTFFVTF